MPSTKSTDSTHSSAVEPLYHVKLLAALRSGDPALIHPFLVEIGKDRRKSNTNDLDTGAAALHLAVRCGTAQTVTLLLSHRAISPNGVHPPGSGTTALHLAASLGRADIVLLLLEQDSIDDTLRDTQGHTCKDVARNKDVVRAIDKSRSFLNFSYRSLLRSYILSPPNQPPSLALISLLESPRVKYVSLSYLDDGSGLSLLHEAARRKDLRLIELAVRAGADVFVRNRRGKMAYEGVGKDDRVRVFLRQFANHDKSLIQPLSPSSEPPALKGYLNKYTNVAKGYNTRWFVLKGGVLSYYRHQEDETVASRGSISMKMAALKVTERTRFEVHSIPPSRSSQTHPYGGSSGLSIGGSVQKWYMKANHPVEAARWTQALAKSIEWYKREAAINNSSMETEGRKSGESDDSAFVRSSPSMHSYSLSQSHSHGHSHTFSSSFLRKAKLPLDQESVNLGDRGVDLKGDASPNLMGNGEDAVPLSIRDINEMSDVGGGNEDEDDEGDDSSGADSVEKKPPFDTQFELHGNATLAQMELTAQMLASSTNSEQLIPALRSSLGTLNSMLSTYIQQSTTRDQWWARQLRKERKRQGVWEESLAIVVKEGEDLERELRKRSKGRGSRVFGPSVAYGSYSSRGREVSIREEENEGRASLRRTTLMRSPTGNTAPLPIPVVIADGQVVVSPKAMSPAAKDNDSDEEYSADEEDEFFDAIEFGTLPNLIVPPSFSRPSAGEKSAPPIKSEVPPSYVNDAPYEGYKNLRLKLELFKERPSTSLWSVLKHSIGKDLTRISFPVFFNEPTSMLQRMAEDMEFSECLDVAAREKDPLRRIAFVAAFAMSNYSSTIGRIAKPFNPMLSETFEYVRLDRKYRYVSEQVSHHPPISACWAESPSWHYYGEVDAQNKFMGKSFEIRPTGVAHAELILPVELGGPGYPRYTEKEGKVVEHYSWKKVTTNVSGFILGSPTIDHYGDMVVTNHRTGDQCVLTFKPRGWRGRDAYEISGQVVDGNGDAVYDIAGRWNSQLIAKKAGMGAGGSLHPDMNVNSESSGTLSPSSAPEYILLWRNSEKPPGSPFNLTPFAITLNDCPATTLKPFLCPTDCRLRPDQRAFEMGKYEEANDLKHLQEEKQRAIRRKRESGEMDAHRPRWFRAETDGDTGERVWAPVRVEGSRELEYWREREKVWREGGGRWDGVDEIFVEEPEWIGK